VRQGPVTHKIERSRASLSGKTWSGRLHTLHGSWSRPFGVMAPAGGG
jgi:hypothetical protein